MKTRMAMILSVTGVLAAGTAAALVNTEVLREDAGSQVTAPAVTTSTTLPPAASTTPATAPATSAATLPATVPIITAVPVTQISTTGTPPGSPPSLPGTDPAGSSPPVTGSATQQQFRLGDAATAILDTANGQLTIVTVAPHPGWVVDRAEQDDPTTVEIRLRAANGEVRFAASLVRGVVAVSLETDDNDDNSGSGSDSSGSGSSGSGSGSGDDD